MNSRRWFLQGLGISAIALTTRGAFAQRFTETAPMTEGPFYPDKMPLDTDNDLLILNDAITPAVGQVTHLTGHVLSNSGEPVRNAFVEIWQTDTTGSYIHTAGRQPTGNDGNFQGYGRFLTDSKGQYYFRTIKPVEYTLQGTFRAPHIHLAISTNGRRTFTTQILVNGHPANARDSIIQRSDPKGLATLLTDFTPLAGSKLSEAKANFEVVLGKTAQELEEGRLLGVGAPQNQRR